MDYYKASGRIYIPCGERHGGELLWLVWWYKLVSWLESLVTCSVAV
jgi:hypothetical protein